MAWCDECDRYFASEYGLQQHLDNAAIHRPVYYCEPCGQQFSNERALRQHEGNNLKHLKKVWDYVCEPCLWGCDDLKMYEKHEEKVHHWCKMHNRYFSNENDLRQHKLSSAHGQPRKCPYCDCTFPTLYAVTLHLESGACTGGMNRRKVDQRVHDMDRSGVITNRKRIGYGEWEPEPDIWATSRAWNGSFYECYFCDNQYTTLAKLNGHITHVHAPKRTENIYHCPACGRQFKAFSQLMGHVEQSEICGVRRDHGVRRMLTGGLA